MKIYHIETDESLKSKMQYGTPDFPFAYYYDEINRYHENSIEWHWHNGPEFSMVLTGPVECYVGKEKMELVSGDVLYINRGTIHRFVSHEGGVMVNFIFGVDFLAPLGSLIHTRYILPVIASAVRFLKIEGRRQEFERMLKSLIRVHNEVEIQADGWEIRVKSEMLSAWARLYRLLKPQLECQAGKKDSRIYARTREMLNYIHSHYSDDLNLEKIAVAANISKSEALRCFKSALEITPMAYLKQYRLSNAKEMLLNGNDTVLQIALKCGFDNSSYFCKVFKKDMGLSPLEFCNKYANEYAGI